MLFQYKRLLSLSALLMSVVAGGLFTTVYAQAPNLGSSSGTGPNDGVDGGDLSPTEACNSEIPIAVLVPRLNPIDEGGYPLFTVSAHPKFFLFTPYSTENIRSGEFTISEYDSPHVRKRLYQTEFSLPATPGITSIEIPNTPEFALKPYQNYKWRIRLNCNEKQTLVVSGYIRRIDSIPEFEESILQANPKIWYDATAVLADRLRAEAITRDPESDAPISEEAVLDRTRWNSLMDYIESDEIDNNLFTPDSMVGPVIISPSE